MSRNHAFTRMWHAPAVRNVRHKVSPSRWYRYLNARRRKTPDYIVAGAQKSGTTSLWAYLSEHPNVEPPLIKEMSYFDRNYQRGMNWYRMHFPLIEGNSCKPAGQPTMTGESTAYYMFHPLVPQRIAHDLPELKIILMLRNPVDRAFSHYQLKVGRNREPLSFDDAIEAEAERLAGEEAKIIADPTYYSPRHDRHSYLARGIYVDQIIRWQKFFSPERLLILESTDLFKRTEETFARVLDFLGLPEWRPAEFGNRFPGRYSDKMSEATRRKLIDYFAPHNARLNAHLGTRYDWDR